MGKGGGSDNKNSEKIIENDALVSILHRFIGDGVPVST